MNASQFKPAGQLAQRLGVKSILFGPPGGGKTPLLNTAPRPCLFATEPGLLSMRGSNLPTIEAYEHKALKEIFEWLKGSAEVKSYDTICFDSVSQLAEIVLIEKQRTNKDGRKAYGELSIEVMAYMNQLYYMPQKHIVMIAKRSTEETISYSMNGPFPVETRSKKEIPYFPGQDLNVKIPHLFDEILYVSKGVVPGQAGDNTKYIRSGGTTEILMRDRSGRLAEYEPHNLSYLFNKAMQ